MEESIGVLGGSFNPPHLGHIHLATSLQSRFSRLLVIPCGPRPDKPSIISSQHRLQMTHLAFQGLSPVIEIGRSHIDDVEVQQERMIPSYHLLKMIMQQNPRAKVEMIIGSDLVPTLGNWIEAEKLQAECYFFVVPRPGYPLPTLSPEHFRLMPAEGYIPMHQSSTEIRDLASAGASDEQLLEQLPSSVLAYIRTHSLYT